LSKDHYVPPCWRTTYKRLWLSDSPKRILIRTLFSLVREEFIPEAVVLGLGSEFSIVADQSFQLLIAYL
jgi:hypothetical protein